MFLLATSIENKEVLGAIRHWENLKVAYDEKTIWVKDFTQEQMESATLQQIPYITLYNEKANLLFKKGSLLPSLKMPSALLWSPILRAIPITLPSLNHNYFGVEEKIPITIQASENTQEAYALLTNYETASSYIETAPQLRLERLSWVVIDKRILIFGTPLLPLKGMTYWRNKDFLIPSGYDFEFPILTDTLQEMLNKDKENWIVWQPDGNYIVVPKTEIKPLSISSFRLTFS